jgi:hypothetical protein
MCTESALVFMHIKIVLCLNSVLWLVACSDTDPGSETNSYPHQPLFLERVYIPAQTKNLLNFLNTDNNVDGDSTTQF